MLKAILGYQVQMTVNLTVKMLIADNSSMCDDGLPVSFTIE